MADEVARFPAQADPAAVVIPVPNGSGYRVVIRGRPDLVACEAIFDRINLAVGHANTVAGEFGLDSIITAAALAAHRGGPRR